LGATTMFHALDLSAKGQYRQVSYGNGVVETFDYATNGHEDLLGWNAATTSGTYAHSNLGRDAAGRIIDERHETPTAMIHRTYEFDDLGRVTLASQVGGGVYGVEWHTYDPLGNLSTRTGTSGLPDRTYTTDAADPDRLCRFAAPGTTGPCQFTYNGAGDVVR